VRASTAAASVNSTSGRRRGGGGGNTGGGVRLTILPSRAATTPRPFSPAPAVPAWSDGFELDVLDTSIDATTDAFAPHPHPPPPPLSPRGLPADVTASGLLTTNIQKSRAARPAPPPPAAMPLTASQHTVAEAVARRAALGHALSAAEIGLLRLAEADRSRREEIARSPRSRHVIYR